jgi:DNA polymerase III epsilon subunit-like protein
MTKDRKIFFFDTETSGLDPTRHTILQIAWVIEIDGEIVNQECHDLKADDGADLNLKALEINNFTLDRISRGREWRAVFEEMRVAVKKAVGGGRELTPCGHNVKFDVDMLYGMVKNSPEKWWLNFGPANGHICLKKPLCTLAMAHYLDYRGDLSLPDYKLTSLCRHFGIQLPNAHDALGDILATRQLFHTLDTLITDRQGVKI